MENHLAAEFAATWELAPAMALARLVLVEPDPERLGTFLGERAGQDPRAALLGELLDRHREGVAGVATILRRAAHHVPAETVAAGLAETARLFDWAVAASPAASVAVYSLGDEGLLVEATAELVGLLERLELLGPGRRLLDLGCGTGRVTVAVAPKVAEAVGIDIAPGMIKRARRRAAGIGGVRFEVTSGRGLEGFADGSFDTVLAVDSLPYLFQAGRLPLLVGQVREVARVLRPGDGRFAAFNLTYRGEPERDRADAAAIAAACGLELVTAASSAGLRTWDGSLFLWRRASP